MTSLAKEMYTEEEVDAALCIWEHALYSIMPEKKDKGDEGLFLNYLKGDEGFAQARDNALHLAKFCEISYIYAKHHGWDDSFDWEFVPRWIDQVLGKFEGPSYLCGVSGIAWCVYIGKEIAGDHA